MHSSISQILWVTKKQQRSVMGVRRARRNIRAPIVPPITSSNTPAVCSTREAGVERARQDLLFCISAMRA